MSADDESDASVVLSERETQFVPRSDDEEVLWEVQEITAERGKKYKVKWAGTNPTTGKPWAQSWVAKHDCTDDLVHEWKAKKKKARGEKKNAGGRASTTSRTSGSSKRAGSSTSGRRTRPSTSDATTSRLDPIRESRSSPLKGAATKRKRQSETPATTTTTTTRSGGRQGDEQDEPSRPLKKQRLALEVLVPPLSSDEDEDGDGDGDEPAVRENRARVAARESKAPSTGRNAVATSDNSDEDSSSPKPKSKSVRRSDARSKGAAASLRTSDSREGSRRRDSKTKIRDERRRREERDADVGVLSDASSQEDAPRPLNSMKKPVSKRVSPPERNDDLSKKKTASAFTSMKVGPPRGAKRQKAPRPPTGSTSSRAKRHEDESAQEHVSTKGPKDQPGDDDAPSFDEPSLLLQDTAGSLPPALPSPRISIPEVVLTERPRSPDLSPGARARLELFDLMMADGLEPDLAPLVDVREHTPDDNTHVNYNDAHDDHTALDASDPPRAPSLPPSKPQPKHLELAPPNGLVVPETESSGTSQSQSHALPAAPLSPQPPPPARGSPHRPTDLPTIAVITASVTSSSTSPHDLFPPPQRRESLRKRLSQRPAVKTVPRIPPSTFRSTVNVRSLVADSEAPPSSIESFASPTRVDKGKQKAIEVDQLQSSLSEGEGSGVRRERPTQRKLTDSELRQRGMELFDQMQLAREAERRTKRKVKRLKTVTEIVHRAVPPPSKGSPVPFASGTEGTSEMPLEGVIDLTGDANSTTLDTAEHSEAKRPLSEEERARLRIELRQEEEESTQEAMGAFPPPLVEEPRVANGGDGQMPAPGSPEINGRPEDADHVEHPSADIQLASVVVQPSQEQPLEDADVEPLPADQPTSSPPHLIPENLTDSPKRRLGEALSLLNLKSEEIQRLQRELTEERESTQRLKTEIAEAKQSSEPTEPVLAAWEAERAQWTQERTKLEKDFATWETQREEWCKDRASLLARVAELLDAAARAKEVNVKLSELETERAAWEKERDALQNDVTRRTEEVEVLTKARDENDAERSKWEAERAALVDEKSRWEAERVELQEKQEAASRSVEELSTSVQSLTSAKVSAEKDRDLFRELYMKASAFVNSTRDESATLEKRVEIAEGQAREGVAGIRLFYEGRIKALKADVARWQGLTALLQEKDKRTNDEVRLRAAQVPELRDLCGRLEAEKTSLEVEVRKLGRAQYRSVAQRNRLYREIFVLKKDRVSLRSKLSKLAKRVDGSTQETVPPASAPASPILKDSGHSDPNDMDISPEPTPPPANVSFDEPLLYPCLWRPQWRDQCRSSFDTKEDLERHMQDHFHDLMDDKE